MQGERELDGGAPKGERGLNRDREQSAAAPRPSPASAVRSLLIGQRASSAQGRSSGSTVQIRARTAAGAGEKVLSELAERLSPFNSTAEATDPTQREGQAQATPGDHTEAHTDTKDHRAVEPFHSPFESKCFLVV